MLGMLYYEGLLHLLQDYEVCIFESRHVNCDGFVVHGRMNVGGHKGIFFSSFFDVKESIEEHLHHPIDNKETFEVFAVVEGRWIDYNPSPPFNKERHSKFV